MRIFGYTTTETDKRYLLSLLVATGIILFWRGIWEASYDIPLLSNVYVSLFLGLLILTLTGLIYREFDPFEGKLRQITKLMNNVMSEVKRGKKYDIHYFDQITKRHRRIDPKNIHRIEQNYIVIKERTGERFVPLLRISKVHLGRKVFWKD